MSSNQYQVLQSPDSININTSPASIQIFQTTEEITVNALNQVSQFQPFSFTATVDGQTTFGPLPQVPLNIITLAITGTLQDPGTNSPDYSLDESGLNIVLNGGIPAGNTVYGMYQVS